MKIRNFCLTLKTNNIKYYLSQLPDIYRTCEVPILFVSNNYFGYLIWKFYAWKYDLKNRNYKRFKKYSGTAYFHIETHEPHLIHCVYKHKLSLPCTLFHELRHWYQQKHMKQFHITSGNYANNTNNLSTKEYNKLPLEVDANTFAKKYCKKIGIRFINYSTISTKRSKLKY